MSGVRCTASVLVFLALASCATNNKFRVDDEKVFYKSLRDGEYPVNNADARTFRFLGGLFGVDMRHVYFTYEIIESADPVTFSVIDDITGRDATSIYRAGKKCDECDRDTFQRIDDDWYIDKNASYSSIGNGWERNANVRTNAFKVLNAWFAKDDRNVFLNSRKIVDADASSFKLWSCGICEVCAEDRNSCYVYERAVPCDCKARLPFPRAMFDIPLNGSYINPVDDPKGEISIDKVDGVSITAKKHASVASGVRVLDLICYSNEKRLSVGKMSVDIKPRRFYRLRLRNLEDCSANIESPTWMRGKDGNPNISIQISDPSEANGYRWVFETEMQPGKNVLTVVCRQAGRDHMREANVPLSVNLEKGHLYRVDGRFSELTDTCEAQLVDEGL